MSDLTSPRCDDELIRGGQRAEAAILSKDVCRRKFELLADPGWTGQLLAWIKEALSPALQPKYGSYSPEGTGRGSEQWKEEAWGMIQAPFSKEGLCQILETFPDCPNCHPHKLTVSLAIATSVVGA